MPRPQKKRYVCCEPKHTFFVPKDFDTDEKSVLLVDEYEVIRLIDYEGCTQEECAEQMNISRTTVQGIYMSARKKIADSLVNGKELTISGGDYILCTAYGKHCGRGCHGRCHKH